MLLKRGKSAGVLSDYEMIYEASPVADMYESSPLAN